jgi:hypothetical protein
MAKRWYEVWSPLVPKLFEVEKPVPEYIREWANIAPERVALVSMGET